MSINIKLSHHPDKFVSESPAFVTEKKVNFVFGKNGTGKTTIADEVKSQLANNYDVCVFKDFEGIAENARLDAVALGTENAAIQHKIDAVDKKIIEIEKLIGTAEKNDTNSLFSRAEKAKSDFAKQDKKIKDFYTSAAGQIKNINNPQIADPTYNTRNFQNEMGKAVMLSDNDVEVYKSTIKADEKAAIVKITFPAVDLSAYLTSANEILQSSVEQRQDIPELKDNVEKRNFAKQGVDVHKREAGENCAFCGNEISSERWLLLDNYFNADEIKAFEKRVDNGIDKVNSELNIIRNVKELQTSNFYDKFLQDVKDLNIKIKTNQSEHTSFLELIKSNLEEKRKNLFVKSNPLEITIPQNFADITQASDSLIDSHNELSQNFKQEQDKARNALRYHEISKRLDEFKHSEEIGAINTLKTANGDAEKALADKKKELISKQNDRAELILQTRDEEKIAKEINVLLTNMGVASFSLTLVENDDENQKGQYQIKGHDDKIRPITHLSKGEKNIIAFLYFVLSLESVDRNNTSRVIVLDDPMTSNDDTMQYLMIGEIQKLYQRLEDDSYIIILTHNCHFYLNVRPRIGEGFYDKYGVYHFLSDGKCTTIKRIEKGKEDFSTSYEILWKELVFLYNAPDATSDLMLSPCRKICETYMKFTKRGIDKFYKGSTNAAYKLFNVNLHSPDDFEAEQNGRTKEEIKNILLELFKQNDAEEHFNNHWKGGGQ